MVPLVIDLPQLTTSGYAASGRAASATTRVTEIVFAAQGVLDPYFITIAPAAAMQLQRSIAGEHSQRSTPVRARHVHEDMRDTAREMYQDLADRACLTL